MHRKALNISNFLSLCRMVLAPIIAGAIVVYPQPQWWTVMLFGVAMLTDFFDGFIARRYNRQTALGAFLDPLADKCLVLGVFAAFWMRGVVPLWVIFVITGRDIVVTALRIIKEHRGQALVTARSAKWKTTLQFATIYVLFFASVFNPMIVDAALYGCVAFTIWTGIAYLF